MNHQPWSALAATYRDGLLLDTIPFWMKHAVDREYGGFTFCLGRDGSVIDTDKGMWAHGRFVWMLSTLYNTVEPRTEWLETARHGVDFIRKYAFDTDGRMFFILTQDGRPVRKRRYLFTETFAVIALAAYAQASGEERARQEAVDLFDLVLRYFTTPGLIPAKVDPNTRPAKGLVGPMITLATAQVLCQVVDDPQRYTQLIDAQIAEIERDFLKPEFEAVLETVGPQGEFIDHFDGRMLNPGHAIEAAWFILDEAKIRGNDPHLIQLGTRILDWMWRWGWDEDYGGILYFRDVKKLPPQEYWHDMKFWWPQNETIIATLLAYQLTGDQKYADWHKLAHDWAYAHFPDPEYGEWYGYLHRDGRVSASHKGNIWKGPFHLPRMQWKCWQIAQELAAATGPG